MGRAVADGDHVARTSRSIQLRNSSRSSCWLGGGLGNSVPDRPSCPAVPDGVPGEDPRVTVLPPQMGILAGTA